MSRPYNIIDADGHVLEPPDFWHDYLDPAYRARAPQLFVDTDGQERLRIEGKVLGGPKGLGFAGAIGARQGAAPTNIRYSEGRRGGFDPHARIPDMDVDNIDAVVLYPTLGLFCGAASDPPFAAALCRAYNRWLADYCKPYPDRLFGAAMLPLQSVELAIIEMRYARKELGMRSGFVRPDPYLNRSLDHVDYEPFWAEAQDLDFAIGLHEGTGVHEGPGATPAMGVDRVKSHGAKHIVSHTMEMMIGCLSVIWGGVCERFPKVRIAFLESGGGWIAGWLDRMDRHFHDGDVFDDSGLRMKPSDYFRRQCWISFEPVEGSLAYLAEYVGPDKILWATDYPHPDGFFPGAPAMIAAQLPEHLRRRVLADSAMQFYKLT
ncbi:MAG: amidohydrolase [Deltaproteobacteria bacterium]|nr:amidohydrolase [Deltaproteobacteria bacterium]